MTNLEIHTMMAKQDAKSTRERLRSDLETIMASCQRALQQMDDGYKPEDPTSYSCIRDIPARLAEIDEIEKRIKVLEDLAPVDPAVLAEMAKS